MTPGIERPEALDCAKQWPSSWCGHTCGRARDHEGICWCTFCGHPRLRLDASKVDIPADYIDRDGTARAPVQRGGPDDFGGSDHDTGFETGWERQMREATKQAQADTKRATYEARLAKVGSAELFIEDHGVLTCYVMLDGGGWGQGFGGMCLSHHDPGPHDKSHRQRGTAQGLDFVLRVLELFGVDKLSQCVGRTVYALYAEPYHLNDPIMGLRLPDFDGGREFLLEGWRKEWEQRKELVR